MIKGRIKNLPLWLREKARKEHDIYNEKRRRDGEVEATFESLSGAFVWKGTGDGHEFWNTINNGKVPKRPSIRIDEYSII